MLTCQNMYQVVPSQDSQLPRKQQWSPFTLPIALTTACLISATEASNACDTSALNRTVGTYTTDAITSVTTIATLTSRGICDVARANRMSNPTIPFAADTEVIIPAQVCEPMIYHALPSWTLPPPTLASWEVQTSTTRSAMTLTASLLSKGLTSRSKCAHRTECGRVGGRRGAGRGFVPQDSIVLPEPVQPYHFTYGTYKDLVEEFGASVGQIIAYNPTYSHSSATAGEGPVLTIPMGCKALSDNVTSMT
ncbi:unnamed protein product [Phytophthora lilii]|uniref:Unnamed protein product n=1 Tax=Phytophthora lilii TaxID=2077276 RepID=A0A9W6WMW3_9STRA|nr:unnamed protein product [Phytophthora lilii]